MTQPDTGWYGGRSSSTRRSTKRLRVPIVATVFEPKVGGHIYDRGTDGSECRWARILASDPPHRVVSAGRSARLVRSMPTRSATARSR